MSRNRVIYQSEALFVSDEVGSTSINDHDELIRVQGANYGFTINRTDVNQFGNLARIDSLVLEPPTVNFDFSYYLTDGKNEGHLGFSTQPTAQFVSGLLSASSGKNFYIVTSDEGQDATTFEDNDPYNLIGIGNAFLTDYTLDLSVGALPTASASFEASNINSQNGNINNQTITGQLPSIQPEDGTIIQASSTIKVPSNTGQDGPTALRPGDVLLDFPGFKGGESVSGTLSNIDGGNGSFHIQSASISIPLSRSPISRLGSKFPYARVVDFPVNATMSVNAILNTVEAGNLANIIAGCGNRESTKDVSVTLKSCEGEPSMKWTLKGATLNSESFSSAIGSNKAVDLTFGVQIGGIDDIDQGIIFSGAHDFGNVAPSISPIGTQNSNDLDNITLQVQASDPNGDVLTYSALGLPPGLSINPSNGLIDGIIDDQTHNTSPYNPTIQVVDNGDPQLTGEASFTWNVYKINTAAPSITTIPTQTHDEGQTITPLQVVATDADGDTLTYSAAGLPGGLSINTSNGLINGTISETAFDNTPYTVNVTVTDDGFPPLESTAPFTWNVNEVVEGIQTIAYFDAAKTLEASGVIGDIPDSWMEGSGISGVTFGSSASYINNEGFRSNNLLEIDIPNDITGIGDDAFALNFKITDISLGDGVLKVGSSAFQDAGFQNTEGGVVNLDLGNSVEYIGGATFLGIDAEFTLPNSLTGIGNTAFRYNNTITNITFPPNLVSVGNDAFSTCPNLSSVDLSGVSDGNVFGYSFRYSDGLTEISIPDHWTVVPYLCFGYSKNLSTINFGTGLTTIGVDAFDRCGITGALNLPPNLVTIGSSAFQNGGGNPILSPVDPNRFTSINFPANNTLETIGNGSFYNINTLTGVDIPDSVTYIGSQAFYRCDNLNGLTIGTGVEYIGGSAFSNCNLSRVEIPNNITGMGFSVFNGNSNLTGVWINCPIESWVVTDAFGATPAATYYVKDTYYSDYIAGDTWSGAQNLAAGSQILCSGAGCAPIGATIIYDGADLQVTGFLGDIPGNYWSVEGSPSDWQRLEIGSSLVNIGGNAFGSNINLSGALTIPSGVRNINSQSFFNTRLNGLVIENGLTGIGSSAFQDANTLTGDLVLPASVGFIGSSAFRGTNFKSVETLGQVANIEGSLLFQGNTSLTGAKINAGTITNGSMFNACTNLTDVEIINANTINFNDFVGAPVTNAYLNAVELANQVFVSRTSLTGVALGPDVASIRHRAFDGCSNLSGTLTISDNITAIETGAFQATKFESVTISCPTGSWVETNAFASTPAATYYVKDTYYLDYIAGNTWSGAQGLAAGSQILCSGAGCASLETIVYADVAKTIEVNSILGDIPANWMIGSGISGVTFGFSATYNGYRSFRNTKITNLEIPGNITGIGEDSFSVCSNLTGVVLNEGVEDIGDQAFQVCASLTSVSVPNSLKTIGRGGGGATNGSVFNSCSNLINIELTDNIERIGQNSFASTNITGIYLGTGISSIFNGAFQSCSNLTDVTINCPIGSWLGINAFAATPAATYTITGAYYQNYTGSSWSGDQGIAAGSTFVSGTF